MRRRAPSTVRTASSNGCGSPDTVPTPTYPVRGMWVNTRAPSGKDRIVRENHSPLPADTNP